MATAKVDDLSKEEIKCVLDALKLQAKSLERASKNAQTEELRSMYAVLMQKSVDLQGKFR